MNKFKKSIKSKIVQQQKSKAWNYLETQFHEKQKGIIENQQKINKTRQ